MLIDEDGSPGRQRRRHSGTRCTFLLEKLEIVESAVFITITSRQPMEAILVQRSLHTYIHTYTHTQFIGTDLNSSQLKVHNSMSGIHTSFERSIDKVTYHCQQLLRNWPHPHGECK